MILNRKDLLKALEFTYEATKPTFEDQTRISIFNLYDNQILACNEYLYISHPYNHEFELALPADELYKIARQLIIKKFSLKEKKKTVYLKSKNIKGELKIFPLDSKVIEFSDYIRGQKKNKIPKNFLEATELCAYCAGTSVSSEEMILKYILYDGEFICASDNYRIGLYELDAKLKSRFLISAKIASMLVKFEDVNYYFADEKMIYFTNKSGDKCIGSVYINEKYPNTRSQFEFKGFNLTLPKSIGNDLNVISQLQKEDPLETEEQLNMVDFNIEDNKLTIRSEGDYGYIEANLKVNLSKKVHFKINPSFLEKILEQTNIMKIGKDRAMFEIGNFKYLVILGR